MLWSVATTRHSPSWGPVTSTVVGASTARADPYESAASPEIRASALTGGSRSAVRTSSSSRASKDGSALTADPIAGCSGMHGLDDQRRAGRTDASEDPRADLETSRAACATRARASSAALSLGAINSESNSKKITASAQETLWSTASVPTTTRASGSTPAVFGSGFPETSTTSVPARASSSSLTRVTPVRRTRNRGDPHSIQTWGRTSSQRVHSSVVSKEASAPPHLSHLANVRHAAQANSPRAARSVQHAQDASLALLSRARARALIETFRRFGGPSHESHDALGEETGSRVVVSAVDGFHERPRPAL